MNIIKLRITTVEPNTFGCVAILMFMADLWTQLVVVFLWLFRHFS
jgi:hypothetical protein